MRKSIVLLIFFLALNPLFSQCPPSATKNVHVVQRGETLSSLSRKYKISVENLLAWNNRRSTDVLETCTQLWVAKPKTAAAVPVQKQVEKQAELPAEKPVEHSADPQSESKPFQFYVKQSGGQHIVQYGETVENLARLYGYTSERFREFNGLSANVGVRPGMVLRSTDCEYAPAFSQNSTPVKTPTPVPATSDPKPTEYQNPISNSTQPPAYQQPTPQAAVPSGSTGMTSEEMQMVNEINLLRSNPVGYIPYVEEYIQYMRTEGEFGGSIATAQELIDVLRGTPSLSILQPAECVYQAAKKHGQDQLRAGTTNHQGSDGSWPWDRILKECKDFQDGNENLVGGPSDVRRAVILLVVDDGIPNRGHRETLLNPHWKYVACYKIGEVGGMPNCWIQNFAM